jgi:glycosyltransferase involved in cell wall biosynthesis
MATASVVIPAHDEAGTIGHTLDAVLRSAEADEFDVIVVCNGCSDRTAEIARTRTGVRVVEIAAASKIAALNAGDEAAAAFPRVYLDADIPLGTDALRQVVAALTSGAMAAAPVPVVDTSFGTLASRAYFAIWQRLGYATVHTLGSGVYGLSAAGRARFEQFPDIIADDGFVYALFSPAERVNPPGATFVLRAPHTLRATIRRRVRIAAGNLELKAKLGMSMDVPGPGFSQVLREHPRLIPAGVVYAATNSLAKYQARKRLSTGAGVSWNRDRSWQEGSS